MILNEYKKFAFVIQIQILNKRKYFYKLSFSVFLFVETNIIGAQKYLIR